jgi:predicted nucleotidyltransferase
LACLWIEKNLTPPSIEFDVLLNDCEEINWELKTEILNLLERKKKWDELDKKPKIEILNKFLEDKIQHFKKVSNAYSSNHIDIEILNTLFRNHIN